jgi:hypothetical protein
MEDWQRTFAGAKNLTPAQERETDRRIAAECAKIKRRWTPTEEEARGLRIDEVGEIDGWTVPSKNAMPEGPDRGVEIWRQRPRSEELAMASVL